MCDFNLIWVLAIQISFDDLDLISRSQVRQNPNYKLFLDSCPLYFNGAWLLHTLKEQTQYALCDWCAFRDITNMILKILHLNVSCLSVCSSCNSSIWGSQNHHVDHSATVMLYLCVFMPLAVKSSLVKRWMWDL